MFEKAVRDDSVKPKRKGKKSVKDYIDFRWSGHDWYMEDDRAWFIDAQLDILCCLNLQTGKCDCAAQLPNTGTDKFMLNTRCIKIGNEIFCMPCYGDKIWIYDTGNSSFQCIELVNENEDQLFMDSVWQYGDKLFAVSRSLRQVIVVDINEKTAAYYPMDAESEDTLLSCCIKIERTIYCTSYKSNRMYQFDMDSKETKSYVIPDVNEPIATMCFDGDRFWLCGYSKKFYVWNQESNTVKVIDDFPQRFGNYLFSSDREELLDCESEKYETQLFCRLQAAEGYVWAIPYRTNYVLYIDKKTFEVNVLPVGEEEETKDSLARAWQFKYFWQYVRDERYLGIFSLKNNYIYEIDTVELKVIIPQLWLSDNYLKLLWDGGILDEGRKGHKMLFERFIKMNQEESRDVAIHQDTIGDRIYSCLK